jgi:hypothetical protein
MTGGSWILFISVLTLQFWQVGCNQTYSLILFNLTGFDQDTLILIFPGIKSVPDSRTVEQRFTYAESFFGAAVHKPVASRIGDKGIAVTICGDSNFHIVCGIVIVHIVYIEFLALKMIDFRGPGHNIVTGGGIGTSGKVNFTGFAISEYCDGYKHEGYGSYCESLE